MPLDKESVVVRASDMMMTRVGADLVILNLATNAYIGLDEIGRRIWEILEAPHRVGDLCASLAVEFDGELDTITADVLSFLNLLEADGLVHVARA